MPQGSVIGPCFFLVYIDDISDRKMPLTRFFADDSIFYRLIFSADDCKALQDSFQGL